MLVVAHLAEKFPAFYVTVENSPPLNINLRQMNPVCALTPYEQTFVFQKSVHDVFSYH
jgi:hypothetical protein